MLGRSAKYFLFPPSMNYLLFWIFVYIVVSVGIGLYAAKKVKTERDYILASKRLPMYVTIATVFATWF